MILTNKYGVKKEIYDRILKDISKDRYGTKGSTDLCVSVTELQRSPLYRQLHHRILTEDIEVDVSEYLTLLFGSAFHLMCEGTDSETDQYEKPVHVEVMLNNNKCHVFGTVDHIHLTPDTLYVNDNKTAKLPSIDKPVDEGYQWQLNVYQYILRGMDSKYDLKNIILGLDIFLKDWTVMQVGKPNYPKCPYVRREVMPKLNCDIEDYIANKLLRLIEFPDDPCTEEERSFGEVTYAVKLPDGEKALRGSVSDTFEEAQAFMAAYIQKNPKKCDGIYIESRGDTRCKYFCVCKVICPYARSKGYV